MCSCKDLLVTKYVLFFFFYCSVNHYVKEGNKEL